MNLPYSCRGGSCATCRPKILSGKVTYGRSSSTWLTEEDRANGFALLCEAKPLTDLVVEVHELSWQVPPPTISPCRVKQIKKLAPDVAVLRQRLPYNDNMKFAAGQYSDFLLEDGVRRSYSIASPPSLAGVMDIELHVRHTLGGRFTDRVFSSVKPGEILNFEGPLGTFYLREDSAKPVILLASGTGFGSIKSIVEYALPQKIARPMTLYWGCRPRRDFYMIDVPLAWAADHPGFRFVPVLSDAEPEDGWTGRTGFVHRTMMEDFPDLSGHQAYACGAPVMVDAARRDFTAERGVPREEFFADAFITEAELPHETA